MIGVTHLFGCNENKPIDGAFSHRPEPPHSTSCLFILHTSGRQIAARGILQQPVGERGSVCVCVCADLSACHFAYTADVYDGTASAAAHPANQFMLICRL